MSASLCYMSAESDLNWSALAEASRQRRYELGLTQIGVESLSGPSNFTIRNIEQAARTAYRERTFYELELSYGWPRGTVAAILRGQEPPSGERATVQLARSPEPTRATYEHEVGAALLALLDVLDRRGVQVSAAAVAAMTEMRERRAARG